MDKILKKERAIMILVFLIAILFRLVNIKSAPASLSMDEVSIGYNAYAILKTGMDEWGNQSPLAFRSVGDYKPPVNIYLTVPFLYFLGLNEFAVRLPIALFGSLTPVVFVLLLKELKVGRAGQLVGGLWFAIVPWHVHFSRGSFEAVLALFFVILGSYLFFLSFNRRSRLLLGASIFSFVLSIWTYHAERLFVPILLAYLYILYKKKLNFIFKDLKKTVLIILPSLVLLITFAYLTLLTPVVRERAVSTSILREQSLIKIMHYGDYENEKQFILDNDFYLIFTHMMGKYLNYFDLRFWFWKGMQFTPPEYFGMGLFYAVDVFVLGTGIYALIKSNNRNIKLLASFWFFAGPLPAAFTMNEQHSLRALVWIVFFGILAALGGEWISEQKFKFKKLFIFFYLSMLLVNIVYFADIYFRQFKRFYSEFWQYGYKEIALFACENQKDYKNVYITDTFGSVAPVNTGIPAVYVLFYCNVDPLSYIRNHAGFEKIDIKRIQWKSDKIYGDSLIIGSYLDLPPELVPSERVIKTLDYPNGKPAFVFVDTTGMETGYYVK